MAERWHMNEDDGRDGTPTGGGDPPSGSGAAIRRLDERTIQQIAAGEVVERPASIVKELVENALDADASRIAVSVTGGGTERIRVRDDGVGIPPNQLPEAVAEHATSKIGDIDDLESGVGTLGFRGEALYTIGAVSRLTIRSRPRPEAYGDSKEDPSDGDPSVGVDADSGAEITVEGGEVGEVRPAGCPVGTTVEVEDVFYNTPAREKFLKTDATEFDHVNRVLTQYALANPDVAVSLEHDGRETFATEGNGDLESAVLAVYGRDVATSMRQVEWRPTENETKAGSESGAIDEETNEPGADDGDPVRRVHGLVSHPETTRASREYLSTFVNGRYVRSSTLRNAVVDAYGGQLSADRYPFAVLFVEVPAETVDVNVHPRKTEIRFDAEAAVRDAVETAVERALLDHGLVRSGAPRGRSAPAETPIEPERPGTEVRGGAGAGDDLGADDGSDTAAEGATRADATIELDPDDEDAWLVEGLSEPETSIDVGTGATDGTDAERSSEGEEEEVDEEEVRDEEDVVDEDGETEIGETGAGEPEGDETTTHHARANREGATDVNASPSPRTWQREGPDGTDVSPRAETATGRASTDRSHDPGSDSATGSDRERIRSFPSPNEQETLDGETTAGTERAFESLPRLRVLGQLHGTYVVAETDEGLALIDQHAADERVNYERLQTAFADGMDAQALAEPVTVELTAREAALLGEFEGALREIGFRTERSGDREVVVSAVPAVFDATLDPELLRDVLGSLVEEGSDDAEPVEDVVDELLADLACYPSITGNTSLTEGSVVGLLDALDDCENPWSCPHGRPVVIRIDSTEIDDRFERDYPGH
jgi:DNA mismatch repair protein MutL